MLGADTARILLVDYQQRELRAYVRPGADPGRTHDVDATIAGRVYRTMRPADVVEGKARHVWVPLVNGTNRLGVLELCLPREDRTPAERWLSLARLVADLVLAKSAYGDTAHVTRRSQPMALRAEAQRALLPPLTLVTARFLVTGILEPSYEVAGDVFDFAADGDLLHAGIFDAMGHSLGATLTATVAVSAYRNCRREQRSLTDTWQRVDEAVALEFDGERFATAGLVQLDLPRGRLRSISAGHHPGLLVRDGRVVARGVDEPALPLGLGGDPPAVTELDLQPGDRLVLYTDGIVEARSPTGAFFGEERLVDLLSRELGSGLPAAEALRRLIREVLDHQDGSAGDDASLLLVEWRGGDKGAPHPAAS